MATVPEEILNGFAEDIRTTEGVKVTSIILYGSSATTEYDPKRSDLNFLVTVEDAGIDILARLKDAAARWRKKRVAVPLVLDKEYIESSLDSFPIEFLNMRRAHRVVWGDDVLADLAFDKGNIRLQAERELKGASLRLRQAFLEIKKTKELLPVIHESLTAFTAIFAALLHIRNEEIPAARRDVLRAACTAFELDHDVFLQAAAVRSGELKLKDDALETLYKKYAAEVRKAAAVVDGMQG